MLEAELARMMNGRVVEYQSDHGVDQAKVDGAALSLCRLHCNAVRPGKRCEHHCAGETDPGIFNCTHMNRMRAFAVAVLNADPKSEPRLTFLS